VTSSRGGKKYKENALSTPAPPPRIAESAALEVATKLPGDRIVTTSVGRGQVARGLWRQRCDASISLWYLDQYQQRLTIADHLSEQTTLGNSDDRLTILCSSDLPEQEFDLAIVPCTVRGEAELQRDLLQQAHARLTIGGRLVSSVDNATDRWLHDQMKEFGSKVSVTRRDDAVVYVTIKDQPLRKSRSFLCEFTFRDREQTITAISRPGVFSHRHLDPGAKAILDAAEVSGGNRIIDIGCGAGTVALALAKRGQDIQSFAIDSNARAVQCTGLGAAKNGIDAIQTSLNCECECDAPASYDVALCNPPYFANFRIAKLFIEAARAALRPGGRIYLVTKHPAWYQDNMYPGWRDTTITQGKQYAIVTAIRG